MRPWHKYSRYMGGQGSRRISIDSDPEAHSATMGGYQSDLAYESSDTFFQKYFFGYQLGRLEYYDIFLRKYLDPGHEILSLASGRCANELHLMGLGYRITCSDLDVPPIVAVTKELFPKFEYFPLNILQRPAPKQYDSIICLSLIYLFDDNDLAHFFENVSKSLKPGGSLILDSAGAPDNIIGYLFDEFWLKYEELFRLHASNMLRGTKCGLSIKHHGFKRTDEEIIMAAQFARFTCTVTETFAFLVEFLRSPALSNLINRWPRFKGMMTRLGKHIPYIRMFVFRKSC
jgi:SAM-dependent methyltransferase